MGSGKEINEFIRECFQSYSLDYKALLDLYGIEDEAEDRDVFGGDTLDMVQIDKAAMVLGVTPDALLTMDDKAVYEWYKKYKYFTYITEFRYEMDRSRHGEDYDALHALDALFNTDYAKSAPSRYDVSAIVERLISLLRDVDKSLPGTFHEGAGITNLSISTTNFFSYHNISRMVRSYIDMVNRAKELFYKAWDTELSDEEVHEYNLLVSALGLQDRAYINKYLYYDLLRDFIKTYKAEGYQNFSTYVRMDHHFIPAFWACTGFVKNKALVQRFIDVCPDAKREMSEFALNASQFQCSFIWSDAKRVHFSPEEEEELDEFNEAIGLEPIDEEDRALETTTVYVQKTKDDLFGYDMYARLLNKLSGPANLGGVVTHIDELISISGETQVSRMGARIKALHPQAGGQ